jgi:hypothetical protein
LECTGLALFSLGMVTISALFENMLMSTLFVPNKEAIYDLAILAQSNYEIQIHSASKDEHNKTLGFLIQELNASKATVAYSSMHPYNADQWDNPEAFINNRFSIFLIALSTTKDFITQTLKSITPNHCTCSEVPDLRLTFPAYSMCWHRLRNRIFRNLNLAKAAGLDLFLDWNTARNEADFVVLKEEATTENAASDSFVSFKNLLPMISILVCLLIVCCLIFIFELKILSVLFSG